MEISEEPLDDSKKLKMNSTILGGALRQLDIATFLWNEQGNFTSIYRCPECLTALWGPSPNASEVATLYAGTLDLSSSLEPVGHIWTRSAQPWFAFSDDDLLCEVQPTDYVPFIERFQASVEFGPEP